MLHSLSLNRWLFLLRIMGSDKTHSHKIHKVCDKIRLCWYVLVWILLNNFLFFIKIILNISQQYIFSCWRYNTSWDLDSSTVFFHASLSITNSIHFLILIFPTSAVHHPPFLTLTFQSFLLPLFSILLFFSASIFYPFLQYAQAIIYSVFLHI